MLRNKLFQGLLLASLTTYANAATAPKCAEAAGNMIVGKVSLECLQVTGTATFDGTSVKTQLHVAGPFDAKSATLNTIIIKGNVKLRHSTVGGATSITGSLEASDTEFNDKIELTTLAATFNHCTTKDIQVTTNKSHKTAYIYLNDNTVVNGNITFTHANGIVVSHNSKITGKVIGGKIQ